MSLMLAASGLSVQGLGPSMETGGVKNLDRRLDLSKAYKQIPVHSDSLWCCVVMVFDPEAQRPAYFKTWSRPCSSSVYGFNKAARAL
eukprot:3171201-Amphidinium_carterae.1